MLMALHKDASNNSGAEAEATAASSSFQAVEVNANQFSWFKQVRRFVGTVKQIATSCRLSS